MKVITKISTCRFAFIKGTNDECTLALMFETELTTANDIMLNGGWCLEIGILYVSRKDIHSIECSVSESYSYALARDNTSIAGDIRFLAFVSV